MNEATVTISLKNAEKLRDWLRDLMGKLHMVPTSNDYPAFAELHGAIEDSHYESKGGTITHEASEE